MAIPLNDNIKIDAPKPSEERSLQIDNTLYPSVSVANATILPARRHIRLIVQLPDGEYWYKDGIADSDLVLKSLKVPSDSEMQTGTDDVKYLTSLKIASWFAWIKTQAQTWAAKQTFIAAPRYSTTTASQFLKVDANKDLVSVSEASDTEMQTGAENTKPTTALRIATWFAWIKTQAQTWAAKQTFSAAPRYSTTTASQFLRVDANKDLVSVSEASDAEMQTGSENTKPTTALRIATWFAWRLSQPFTFSNLIGVGVRIMQVNSAGDVSAPYFVQEGFVTDSDVIIAIIGATYNSGNNFTATLIPANSKVFNQGQWYKNLGVLYYATADNQSSRITLS